MMHLNAIQECAGYLRSAATVTSSENRAATDKHTATGVRAVGSSVGTLE